MLDISLFLFLLVIFLSSEYDKNLSVKKLCSKNVCIPRIVWSHWAGNNLPEDVEEMVNVSRKSLENFTYWLLNPSNLCRFLKVSIFPATYDKLHLAGKADYIRVSLVSKYGGVYVDSTTYINSGSAMEWFFSETVNGKGQITTFKDGYPPRFFSPSFFGAVENCLFMQKFKTEFDLELEMNAKHSYYLIFDIVNKMVLKDQALRSIVQTLSNEQNSQRLIFECHFFKSCVRNRLLHDPIARAYPFIKLFHNFREGRKYHIGDVGYFTGIYNSKKNFIWERKIHSFNHFSKVKRKKRCGREKRKKKE